MKETYYLKTYGCQMNVNDSEIIDGMMGKMDYVKTESPEKADVIILNTCCVREGVDNKVYGRLGDYKRLKRRNPSLLLVVCGCLAQKDGKKLMDFAPHLDLVVGTNQLGKLPDYINEARETRLQPVHIEWELAQIEDEPVRDSNIKAWISISYGCDNFCSFCIVPYVRGRERSRPLLEILKDIEELAADGYKEITLLGQNVNTYGKGLPDNIDFGVLLKEVNKIEGIERIRFTTSHPKDFKKEYVEIIKSLDKVCEWFHLPLQAGDDTVLKNMNRGYTVGEYKELVENIKNCYS